MRDNAYKTETIEHNDHVFKVEYLRDDRRETPWECSDGHGAVSEWTSRDKKSGEVVLCSDRNRERFYDMRGAIKKAKAEGWSCASVLPTDTQGQKAVKAAQADFDYLRSWCNDDWGYACLHVTLLDADGDELDDYDDYLGGVEDGYTIRNGKMYALGGHANECALVLADKILDSYKKDQDTELTAALHSVKDDAMYQSGII